MCEFFTYKIIIDYYVNSLSGRKLVEVLKLKVRFLRMVPWTVLEKIWIDLIEILQKNIRQMKEGTVEQGANIFRQTYMQ